MKRTVAIVSVLAISAACAFAHEGEEHEGHEHAAAPATVTVTGEVLDMACYLDHGATGAKHADCAKTCLESGLPAGIKGQDGKVYLLIGEHKPINALLAPLAAKTITVRGKAVSRDGVNMIENVEIVSPSSAAPAASTKYVCPMCPDVVSDKPGRCPKCGMKLEVKK